MRRFLLVPCFLLALAAGAPGQRLAPQREIQPLQPPGLPGQPAQPAAAVSDEQAVKAAKIDATGAGLIEFFKGRTQQTGDKDKIKALIGQLGDKEAATRDKAFGELVKVGMPAVPLLRQAANNVDEAESSPRARECLKLIDGEGATGLVTAAARHLAKLNPEGAVEALLGFLPAADDEKVSKEIEQALTQVAVSGGKLSPALVNALKDDAAARRAVAVQVICQVGDNSQREGVKPLLKDPKPSVRVRAALGLARRHDAEAIPVLIDLLSDLPADQQGECEEFLTDLAGEWHVAVPKGSDAFVRKLRREVWTAWWKATEGKLLLDEFKARTLTEDENKKLDALVKDLAKDSQTDRDRTAAALVAFGPRALPHLRKASQDTNSKVAEGARRAAERIEREGVTPLPTVAAKLVALRKPEGAAEVLLNYLPFADNDEMTEVLQAALPEMVLRDGKADPAFLKALTDAMPARRAAAAEALARHDSQKDEARKALKDNDAEVRMRAALALASAGDKEAVPVLTALLSEAPVEVAWQAEEYLSAVAGDKKPNVALGSDDASRKKAREAWEQWWKDNGEKAALVRRDPGKALLGFTLVVEQHNPFTGNGRILELDNAGKIRWEVNNIMYPMDAQVVGRDRVLIAEHNMNRVVEMDFKGNVLWQKQVFQPVNVERLKNGNTFVARRNQLVELDREGKEVVRIDRNQDYILAAGRTRDGGYVFVSNTMFCFHLDRAGKEVRKYQIPQDPQGGARYFNVLANGNVLLSEYNSNRVTEYDREGKKVWTATVTWPNAATKLSNGTTLVTSMNQQKIIELDRSGKMVREFKENFRPFKAERR